MHKECRIALVLIALVVAVTAQGPSTSDLVVTMKAEAQKLSQAMPGDAAIMTNIQSTEDHNIGRTTSDGLMTFLNTWNVPADVKTKFQMAAFADSVNFETFTFSTTQSTTHLDEYVGATKNVNGIIVLGYMHVAATGTPVPQHDTVKIHECHRCWLVARCCSDHYEYPVRGFTEPELEAMIDIIRATAYAKLVSTLDSLPTMLVNYASILQLPGASPLKVIAQPQLMQTTPAPTPAPSSLDLLQQAIAKVVADFQQIESAMHSESSSTIVQQITGRGFSSFSESVNVEKIMGVSDAMQAQFIQVLGSNIQMPAGRQQDLNNILMDTMYIDSTTWVAYQLQFALNSGGTCKSVTILAHHDSTAGKTDYFVADVQASFTLAPDLFVISESHSYFGGLFGSSSEKIVTRPRGITLADTQALYDFFEIVAFKRFAEMIGVPTMAMYLPGNVTTLPQNYIAAPQPLRSLSNLQIFSTSPAKPSAEETFKSLVRDVVTHPKPGRFQLPHIVQKIVNTAKKIQPYVGPVIKIVGLIGGDPVVPAQAMLDVLADTHAKQTMALGDQFMDAFLQGETVRLGVPAKYFTQFHALLMGAATQNSSAWVCHGILMSIDPIVQDGKHVTVCARHSRATQSSDWMVADMQTPVALPANTFTVRSSTSLLGGRWSSRDMHPATVPAGLNEAETHDLMDMFEAIAFERFGQSVNINPPKPCFTCQ